MFFTPLREDRALRFSEAACLPLRSVYGQCRACAQVCPRAALDVSVEAVVLNDSCIDCGRCIAVCPTEALALADVAALEPVDSAAELRIECFKVPASRLAPGTIRVPCCGSVSAGRLLELAANHAETPISIVNRGWCGSCNAGGGVHPAENAIAEAVLWLESVGTAVQWLPRLVTEALEVGEMPDAIPRQQAEDLPLNRRQFLRAMIERPAGLGRVPSAPVGADGVPVHPASERRPSPERQRQVDALDRVASRNQAQLPSELFPRVSQTGECVDHRICVALCPTGALRIEAEAELVSLSVDGTACIACGTCARSCPDSALVVEAHGGSRGLTEIARHAPRYCEQCGSEYTGGKLEDNLCMSCRKSRYFTAALFGRSPQSTDLT